MTERDEQLPRPATELEQLAIYYESHDTSTETVTLNLLEDHAALTRTGTNGIAQIATKGLIAAESEHWDSRAGDPSLHTRVAIQGPGRRRPGK